MHLYAPRLGLLLAALLALPAAVLAREPGSGPSDRQARERIVRESVAAYLATGHPCACPYDTARNGSACGRRSAYTRSGGAAPPCYPADVTDGMLRDRRARNR